MFANFIKFDLLNHMICTNLIPKFQKGTITQRDKKHFKVGEKRAQNFAFLDTLGYLVTLRPNGFSELNQIWRTSSQGSTASPYKILGTCLKFKYHFFAKNTIKRLKDQKIRFFGHICPSIIIRIMKFGLNKLVPHMNSHVKFHNPVFTSFRVILF